VVDTGSSPKNLPRTREEEQISPNTALRESSSTPHPVDRLDVASSDSVLLGSEREAHGRPSSISGGLVDADTRLGLHARTPGLAHTSAESAGTQGAVQSDTKPEIKSQLTALPEEDSQEGTDSQEAYETQDRSVSGRPFGALNQHNRSYSANRDFTTPDSPPFSIHRHRFELGQGMSIWTRMYAMLADRVHVQLLVLQLFNNVRLLVRAHQQHRDRQTQAHLLRSHPRPGLDRFKLPQRRP
jgi:hypothetical protein